MSEKKVTLEQKGFEQVGKVSETIGHKGAPLIDRIFGRWLGTPADRDWVVDAEWGRIQQEPVHARRLLYVMVLSLVALLIWAANAPLDEVARVMDAFIPSRQLQVVQSLDGGIVEEILVREGQIVEQGDLLLRIDPTRAVSSLRESRAQFLSLTAEVARLQALIGRLEEPDFSS
ncbi:MAG: biotin/lipoyl-binding protein [Nitrincola sp.]|nr:biotin/lipoyl-binding protein [Nitrincola sp.]